jgi:hypothetical protein
MSGLLVRAYMAVKKCKDIFEYLDIPGITKEQT